MRGLVDAPEVRHDARQVDAGRQRQDEERQRGIGEEAPREPRATRRGGLDGLGGLGARRGANSLHGVKFLSMQGNGAIGRLPIMHGSRPAPSDPGAHHRVDLLDVGLLLLPVVVGMLAFVLANRL